MEHETKTPEMSEACRATERKSQKHKKRKQMVTATERRQMVELHHMGFGTRKIADKLGVGRKVVRKVLEDLGRLGKADTRSPKVAQMAGKLDPFREQIKEKVKKRLTVSRILREIRAEGYTGGRTILADYVRTIRTPTAPKKKVWRRFETRPGEETQVDWSPYRVEVGGKQCIIHAFAATLGYSRKTHVRFYPNERQSTLLEAHTHAFTDFGGVTQRVVYDRMASVVLGTVGPNRKPIWHPRFLDFARYYGYEPYLCKVADPDRKGKDERIFWFLERDFIRGSKFDSFEDLNARVRVWLDEVANCRVHGTTRRIPDEAWQQERTFLISLPDLRFPACEEELRQVGPDAVVSVRGTPYTVPAELANRKVSVRLYAEHFEVLDGWGQVAFSRRYVPEDQKGKLVIDPSHYQHLSWRSPMSGTSTAQLEDAFLTRFPTLANLVTGIKLRMKSLSHIHLRALWRSADQYGDDLFLETATQVQAYRRFDALAVQRLLERLHGPPDEKPTAPLHAAGRVLLELGDVESGSLDDYAHLDTQTYPHNPDQDTGQNEQKGDRDVTEETTKPQNH